MATYKITIVNEHFTSSNEHECEDAESARRYAVTGALAIAAEQVTDGSPFFGAEVTIQDGDEPVARFVIAAGASPLKTDAHPIGGNPPD